MKTSLKAALALLAFAGATAAATAPAAAQNFGLSIGPRGGIGFSFDTGGYCDSFGCPGNFWDMPVYYGPVFWHGQWYDGPLYYRDAFGRRQFWIHGDWHFDEWRGPHPSWWREGRYGPALGQDYYRSHGFHGRWDQRDNRGGPGFDRRDNGRDFGRDDRRDDRGGDRAPHALDQRGPQANQAPQGNAGFDRGRQPQAAAPQAAPATPAGQPPRGGRYGRGGYNPGPALAPGVVAPAPAPAAPAAAPAAGTPPAGGQHRDHPAGQ